jgi:hypothetical protein
VAGILSRLFLSACAGARRRVDIVAGEALVGVLAAALESFAGRGTRDEAIAAVADEVGAFGLAEGIAHLLLKGFRLRCMLRWRHFSSPQPAEHRRPKKQCHSNSTNQRAIV